MTRGVEWERGAVDDEGRMRAIVGGGSEIWVPPSIEIASAPDNEGNSALSITYPIPGKWQPPVERSAVMVSELGKVGWKKKNDTKGMLNDFIKIADGSPVKVRNFVLKWGPLWLCRLHPDCIWTDSLWRWPEESLCQWLPYEPIDHFQKTARKAKAAFNIAIRIMENKLASEEDWEFFFGPGCENYRSIREQRFFLTRGINIHLWLMNSPRLRLHWENEPRGKITINTDLGFIRALWLQIAQLISSSQMLYICDGCGDPYLRQYRKAPEGRRNYCERCGSRASKRDWARDKRGVTHAIRRPRKAPELS